jgi:hypothetical protein
MMTECDVVLIVRTTAARDAVLNAVTDGGVHSVVSEVQVEGSKMSFFRNHDGRKVGIIVSAASSDVARKRKMEGVAMRISCPCIGLIDPGYTAGDINPRSSQVPKSCALVFVEDVEMLMDLLGYRHVQPLQREVLRPLFLRREQEVSGTAAVGPDPVPPRPPLFPGDDSFRAFRAQAAEMGPPPFHVVDMPATPAEAEALNRSRQATRRRTASIMVNDVEPHPRFERAVPSAAAVAAASAPNRRAPPYREDPHYSNMDFMGNPMDMADDLDDEGYIPYDRRPPYPVSAPWLHDGDPRGFSTPPPVPVDQRPRPAWMVEMIDLSRPIRNVRPPPPPPPPPPLPNDPRERAHEMLLQQMRDADNTAADNAAAMPPWMASPSSSMPMTNQERRRRSRLRVDERSQQQALTGLVANKETKKALAKKREESTEIEAMCISAEDNSCTICMEKHITTMVLPCRHASFCHACITYWVDAHSTCPTCKAEVATTVQMITKFDAIEEHKRRRLEADSKDDNKAARARRKEVAAALRKEADELEAAQVPKKEEG